jgi:hypothetical protein
MVGGGEVMKEYWATSLREERDIYHNSIRVYLAGDVDKEIAALKKERDNYRVALIDAINQACRQEDGSLFDCALSAYEDAIDLLVEDGYIKGVKSGGRFVHKWSAKALGQEEE